MTSPESHGKVLVISFIQQVMDWVSVVGQATEMDPGDSEYSQEMVSGLEAPTGTSVPNPVFISVYHEGESVLFSKAWEEWCSHLHLCFPLCISNILWVKWDYYQLAWKPKQLCASLFLQENAFRLSNIQPFWPAFRLGSVWVGKYEQRLFRVRWGNLWLHNLPDIVHLLE